MNAVVQLAASLAAIIALFGLARWLGLGREARIDGVAHARQIAFDSHYGFTATDAIVDRAGFAALVRDASNRHILIKAHGAHFVTRMITPPIEGRLDHQFLTLVAEDAAFGAVTLNLGDQAQYWASGLRHIPSAFSKQVVVPADSENEPDQYAGPFSAAKPHTFLRKMD